jgi:hypothetical protein
MNYYKTPQRCSIFNQYDGDISEHRLALINELGCASHSDNTSDKELLTDEEFTHIIHSLETRPGSCWLCRSIKRKIKELRQERE